MIELAWEEGRRAGEQRKPRCPYQAGTRESWSWQSGYVEGAGKRTPSFVFAPHCV